MCDDHIFHKLYAETTCQDQAKVKIGTTISHCTMNRTLKGNPKMQSLSWINHRPPGIICQVLALIQI